MPAKPPATRPSNIAKRIEFAKGDTKAGFAKAEVVIERSFTTQAVHQGYIEPHAALASASEDGQVQIWSTTQGHFQVRGFCARLLNMETSQIRVTPSEIGGGLMVRALDALEDGTLTLTPQPEGGVTYATKIDKGETRIDWSRPAQAAHDHIRGLSPFPGAWFEMPAEKGVMVRVKALRSQCVAGPAGAPGTARDDALTIACGDGAVRLLQVQRAGKQPMQAEEFLRGVPIRAGAVLG